MRTCPKVTTFAQKVEWLLKNQKKWEGWIDVGDPRRRDVVEAMRTAGLISKKTYWKDVNVTSMINAARVTRITKNANKSK